MLNSKTYNSKHKLEEEENEAKPLQKTTAETSVEKQSKKKKIKNNQGKEKPIPQSLGSLNQKVTFAFFITQDRKNRRCRRRKCHSYKRKGQFQS